MLLNGLPVGVRPNPPGLVVVPGKTPGVEIPPLVGVPGLVDGEVIPPVFGVVGVPPAGLAGGVIVPPVLGVVGVPPMVGLAGGVIVPPVFGVVGVVPPGLGLDWNTHPPEPVPVGGLGVTVAVPWKVQASAVWPFFW